MVHYTVSTLVTQEQIHTTKFPPLYEKYICNEKKNLFRLKSSQYPVWMTQNLKKGGFGESKSKQFPAPGHPPPPPPPPLEACTFGDRLGNRSLLILDPWL